MDGASTLTTSLRHSDWIAERWKQSLRYQPYIVLHTDSSSLVLHRVLSMLRVFVAAHALPATDQCKKPAIAFNHRFEFQLAKLWFVSSFEASTTLVLSIQRPTY